MATESFYTESGTSPPLMPTMALVQDLIEYLHKDSLPHYPVNTYNIAAAVYRWWPELRIDQRDELSAVIVRSLLNRGLEVQS